MVCDVKTYYDPEEHKYYVNGEEKPSVTEIASPISFERLDALQKALVERAKERGKRCHELAEEFWLTGELDPEEIENDFFPYMQQFILWAKTYRPKVLYTEKQLFSEVFCGTADLIAELDGKIILVDYKFTSQLDTKSLSVQLEGYKKLCGLYGIKIDKCYALHIKKGSYIFKEIEPNSEWFEILLKHNKFMRRKNGGTK